MFTDAYTAKFYIHCICWEGLPLFTTAWSLILSNALINILPLSIYYPTTPTWKSFTGGIDTKLLFHYGTFNKGIIDRQIEAFTS